MEFLKNAAALLKVKTIITLVVIAVFAVLALNGNIVPKAAYAETVLSDGDSIEIVSFVGGG